MVNTVKSLIMLQRSAAKDALKAASKRENQKTAKTNGDLIVNKIADKITKTTSESTTDTGSSKKGRRET